MRKPNAVSFLFFLGFIFLASAGVMAWQKYLQPVDAVVMECDPSQYDSLALHQTVTVQIKLTNRSSVPAKVIGLAPC